MVRCSDGISDETDTSLSKSTSYKSVTLQRTCLYPFSVPTQPFCAHFLIRDGGGGEGG